MNCYHLALINPCTNCKGSDVLYSDFLTKLLEQLRLPGLYSNGEFTSNELPSSMFEPGKSFFQLILPGLVWNSKDPWFNLTDDEANDLFLERMLKYLNNVNCNDLDYAEIIAEQLHDIADLLTDNCYILSIYWLSCGHTECMKISNSIPLYGALRRLHSWNNAAINFICNTDSLCESTELWFQELDISVINLNFNDKISVDKNIRWQGSLQCLQDEQYDKNQRFSNWRLSSRHASQVQPGSETDLPFSNYANYEREAVRERAMLADHINVIRELPRNAIPCWRIFPSQFILYHKSLVEKVYEIQELLDDAERQDKETLVLLASISTCHGTSEIRTTKDWMEFYISTESDSPVSNDKVHTNSDEIATFHLVLYPAAEEPGIFIAYFLRPEASLINIQSFLAVYQAAFHCTVENTEKDTLCEDWQERKCLQLLDVIQSSHKSPLKSQFSLAVHLDASEMLKHFTKDGKPLKKELKSLLRQIGEKQKESPSNKKERQKRLEITSGVEYCLDTNSDTAVSASPRLLPKHETLSICNTPKTLAKAKLQDVKRKISKSQETLNALDGTDAGTEQTQDPSTSSTDMQLEQLEQKNKLTKSSSTEQSKLHEAKASKVLKQDPPAKEEKSPKKRRSFDGNESVKPPTTDPNEKEKRSDRHKRRLVRVVKRSLVKYGVDPAEEYYTTCSERLYYLCKSFLKDLKTSQGLNSEMKKLADSNVAAVVEFERRQHISKTSENNSQNTTTHS